eukprot:TRINITY_DN74897_c0_g1_i1.p1 TRINITY_DN74897_c0_g1~~TRINITY_DN74897_c0_g1_i1.p1  ORF type:complete len:191 (+),score=30.89 TRINITY_DN74897_c0_g1_i1:59-631(+)
MPRDLYQESAYSPALMPNQGPDASAIPAAHWRSFAHFEAPAMVSAPSARTSPEPQPLITANSLTSTPPNDTLFLGTPRSSCGSSASSFIIESQRSFTACKRLLTGRLNGKDLGKGQRKTKADNAVETSVCRYIIIQSSSCIAETKESFKLAHGEYARPSGLNRSLPGLEGSRGSSDSTSSIETSSLLMLG